LDARGHLIIEIVTEVFLTQLKVHSCSDHFFPFAEQQVQEWNEEQQGKYVEEDVKKIGRDIEPH